MKPATDRPADKRLEKGQETRRAIVETATRLFAERGYAEVSIEAVLAACRISRGALYHHFPARRRCWKPHSRRWKSTSRPSHGEVVRNRGRRGRRGADRLRVPSSDLTQDPAVRQIMLTDAPSVLGWDKWREIDERHAFGLMKAALEPAAREAGIAAALVDAFTRMLLASLSEIALMIAEADNPTEALENGKGAVRELLGRILARPA